MGLVPPCWTYLSTPGSRAGKHFVSWKSCGQGSPWVANIKSIDLLEQLFMLCLIFSFHCLVLYILILAWFSIFIVYYPWRIRMYAIYGSTFTINIPQSCQHIYIYIPYMDPMGYCTYWFLPDSQFLCLTIGG